MRIWQRKVRKLITVALRMDEYRAEIEIDDTLANNLGREHVDANQSTF